MEVLLVFTLCNYIRRAGQFKHSTEDFIIILEFQSPPALEMFACSSLFQNHLDFEILVKSSVTYLNYYISY